MKDIAIYGAGGFGREVQSLISQLNDKERIFNFVGFFDDGKSKGELVNGFPVQGGMEALNAWGSPLCLALAIGDPKVKKRVFDGITNPLISFPSLIHPSVMTGESRFVRIGDGCIICGGTIITVNIVIERFVILNLSCAVGHDTQIGAFSSFMPTVNISGEVNIGEGVYVGTGAKIINQLEIGAWTTVGAGAVVAKSLPAHCTAVGVPAKPIKFHDV